MKKKKSNVDSLLEYLFKEQTPEASEDEVFGQYLFADPKYKLRKDKVQEPDTAEEEYFKDALSSYYLGNEKVQISDVAGNVKDLQDQGSYSKYINPPDEMVYRTVAFSATKVPTDFLSAMKMSIDDFKKLPKNKILQGKPGILNPKPNDFDIQGWTLQPNVLTHFMEPGMINVVFVSDASDSGNFFFMNPDGLKKTFKSQGTFETLDENETISYGPVKYGTCFFYIPSPGIDDDHLQIELVRKLQ